MRSGRPPPDTLVSGDSVCTGTPPPSGPPLRGVALEGGTILSWFLGADIAHSFSYFFIRRGALPFHFVSHPHPWDTYPPFPQLSPRWRLWKLMDVGMTGAML